MCVYLHVKKCVRVNKRERERNGEEIRSVFIAIGNVEDYSESGRNVHSYVAGYLTPHHKYMNIAEYQFWK